MLTRKKFVSVLLVVVCLAALTLPVFATEGAYPLTTMQTSVLAEGLYEINCVKDTWGLSDVDFMTLRIGMPVQTLVYKDDMLQNDRVMYPIIYDEDLIMWALPTETGFQFSTSLTKEVNDLLEKDEAFTVLYDTNGAYLYTENDITRIHEYKEKISGRGSLDFSQEITVGENLCVTLRESYAVTYGVMPRSVTAMEMCNVYFVRQNHDYTCWAASAACISNYLNDTNYTDEDVAAKWYGVDDPAVYDNPLNYENGGKLLDCVDVSSYSLIGIETVDLHYSITRHAPILAYFAGLGNGNHFCVIYGANPDSDRIMVMDPDEGFMAVDANSSGYYIYNSPSGYSYELDCCWGK